MEIDKETEKKLQEMQLSEQALQSLLLQKQAFQLELSETENAISEVEKTSGDVFKVVGQVMVRKSKEEILDELKKRKEILELRVRSIEKQEENLRGKLEELKKEIMSGLEKK